MTKSTKITEEVTEEVTETEEKTPLVLNIENGFIYQNCRNQF